MGLNIDASAITSGIINPHRLPPMNGNGNGGGGTGTDEVWIGAEPPSDAAAELWYDTDATEPPAAPTHDIHTQAVPAAIWTIEHALGFYPSVTIVDSAGDEVVGDVNYPSMTTVVVSFSGAFSGAAYLS